MINEEDGINRALISFCLKKGEKEEKEEEEFWEDCNGFRRWDEEDSLCVWTTGRKLGARLEDCFIGHFIKLGTVAQLEKLEKLLCRSLESLSFDKS